LTHERSRQTVRRTIRLPSEQILGVQTPVIDAIDRASADARDSSIGDADVEAVTVRMEDRSTLDPFVDAFLADPRVDVAVNALRPALPARIGRSRPPWICNPIDDRCRATRSICDYTRAFDRRNGYGNGMSEMNSSSSSGAAGGQSLTLTTGGITLLGVLLSIGITIGFGISGPWWLRTGAGLIATLVLILTVRLGTSGGRGPLARFASWVIASDSDERAKKR
jgi:hypothetical protein